MMGLVFILTLTSCQISSAITENTTTHTTSERITTTQTTTEYTTTVAVETQPIGPTNAEKIVMCIEANELNDALQLCKNTKNDLNTADTEKIIKALTIKLNRYLNTDTWVLTKYKLVDEKVIKELHIYQKILSALPIENHYTNANKFVSQALNLVKYINWNNYYLKADEYFDEMLEYMNMGAEYRGVSWNITISYYQKAYNVANTAYNYYKGKSGKGMVECANMYKAFAGMVDDIINERETSSYDSDAYEHAMAKYKVILQEYIDTLSSIQEILDAFPTKIY